MAKGKVKGLGNGKREQALKAVMGGLSLMVAAAGMPGQVRLASREQQPLPRGAAVKKGKKR
jgi:hypothetical protein